MEVLYTTHDKLSHPFNRHKQLLRSENVPTAEFWSSVLEMAEILFPFIGSIRTGR